METLSKNWGWLLALGILMVILGVLVIGAPGVTGIAVGLLLGWILMIGGIAHGVHAFMAQGWRGFLFELLSGILYLVVGVMLVADPLGGVLALTVLLAVFLVVEGIFKIITALRSRPLNGWIWLLMSGVASVILGGLIWAQWPISGLWAIGLLVGIYLLFSGWSLMMLAFAARAARDQATAAT